jgi:hypothetical protein
VSYGSESEYVVGVTRSGQPVVAESGDGQRSALAVKRDRIVDNKKRLIQFETARTTFYAESAKDTDKWNRLWKHQHEWNSDDTGRREHQDKVHLSHALADSLHLSAFQKRRVVDIVTNTNGRRFNQIGGIEALVLGAIAYIGEVDAKEIDDRIVGSESFEAICELHDVEGWNACKKIKDIMKD